MKLHPVSLTSQSFERARKELSPLVFSFSRKDDSQQVIETKVSELAGRKFTFGEDIKSGCLVTCRDSEIYTKFEGRSSHHLVLRPIAE